MAPTARDIHADRVLILDFGAQYTQLIARRVRESGVYSEIHPWDMDADAIREFGARGIILSGGPESVNQSAPPRAAQLPHSRAAARPRPAGPHFDQAEQSGRRSERDLLQSSEGKAPEFYPFPSESL